MKPFTLEWWLSRLVSAELDLEHSHKWCTFDEIDRREKLADWIRKRILHKYGEQELNG